MNVYGGVVFFGYFFGCSGVCIFVILFGVLKEKNGYFGVVGVCNGGGGVFVVVVEFM